MDFSTSDVGSTLKVALQGRLDTAGVDRIETRFTATVVPARRPTIVDLSAVPFVSSMGIRMLLSAARALSRDGVSLALYGAQPVVHDTLRSVIADVIPLVADEAQAIAQVGTGSGSASA